MTTYFKHTPTMAEVAQLRRVTPKGQIPTVKAVKAKKDRQAAKVVQSVRAKCVARDGDCRVKLAVPNDVVFLMLSPDVECRGESEWAHLGEKKRAKTRGQAPDVRHTTELSAMLCTKHHNQYDGRERPRLVIEPLSPRGADGPLRFTTQKESK